MKKHWERAPGTNGAKSDRRLYLESHIADSLFASPPLVAAPFEQTES